MFEKEAEEIAKDIYIHHFDDDVNYPEVLKALTTGVQKGAEFGYNKADEWHFMKDVNCYEDLHFPPEEEKGRVLIWKVQVITEKGIKEPVCYHCGSYGDLWYEINAYHVIAWKEIVLPELKETE